jgi:uncharacterized protein YndB with AHSA1/START domain
MAEKFSTTVIIDAAPMQVWTILTDQMTGWMGEPEMQIEIITDWKVNSPILIKGFHHVKFENRGIVLQYEEGVRLSYSHLSNVSRLPDIPENYTILEFVLTPAGEVTILTLNIENFPTEVIRKHLEFYWRTTIFKIKKVTEDKLPSVR